MNIERDELLAVNDIDTKTANRVLDLIKSTKTNLDSITETMIQIDKLIGTHGVEAINASYNYYLPRILYCSTGDSYQTTLLYDFEKCEFLVESWGHFVENLELDEDEYLY